MTRVSALPTSLIAFAGLFGFLSLAAGRGAITDVTFRGAAWAGFAFATLGIAASVGLRWRSLNGRKLRLAVLTLAAGTGGFAGPVTYDITFSGGSPEPAGSFTYDASAPLTSRFSNFVVSQFGWSFDFTSAANTGEILSGTSCGTTPSSQSVFTFLSGTHVCANPAASSIFWMSQSNSTVRGPFAFFDEQVGTGGASYAYIIVGAASSPDPNTLTPGQARFGSFTIAPVTSAPASAPEPGSVLLVMTGVCLILFWRWRGVAVRAVRSSLLVLLLGVGAFAAPVTYNITFSGGSPQPSGSFAYDASAPLTSRFSSFVVSDFAVLFDLTSAANTGEIFVGSSCGSTPTSQSVFTFLSGTNVCANAAQIVWFFQVTSGFASFGFRDVEVSSGSLAQIIAAGNPRLDPQANGAQFGSFTIAPVQPPPTSTPEPGSLIATLTGIGLISWRRLRRPV